MIPCVGNNKGWRAPQTLDMIGLAATLAVCSQSVSNCQGGEKNYEGSLSPSLSSSASIHIFSFLFFLFMINSIKIPVFLCLFLSLSYI